MTQTPGEAEGWVDVLAHLDDPRFTDAEAHLREAEASGITDIVSCGVDPLKVGELPEDIGRLRVWRALGVHPSAADGAHSEPQIRVLRITSAMGALVAIGEIGLDGRDGMPSQADQEHALVEQLRLAKEMELPVVLHCVQRLGAMLEILREHAPVRGVWHGFTGPPDVVPRIVELGLHVSFGMRVCDPKAKRCRAAAEQVPRDRLLVETDTPDAPPVALRRVIEALAGLRGEPASTLGAATATNARHLYKFASNASK
jgi:TatD DNase family protein